MTRILIIENDIFKCKKIINCISQSNLNVKNLQCCLQFRRSCIFLKKQIVDLIILDTNLINIKKLNFFEFLFNEKLYKYRKSIIAIVGFGYKSLTIKEEYYVFDYIINPIENIKIVEVITNYVDKYSFLNLKLKIAEELSKLNFKFSYNGTQYLIDCIYEVYSRNYIWNVNLSKEIFPILSIKYNKPINTIHNDIKHAINNMYFDCEEEILKKYFNYFELEKPKLKNLIFKVINNL